MSIRGKHARRPPRNTGGRSGYVSAFLLGLSFLLGGVLAVGDPQMYWSAGGIGTYASTPVTTVYSPGNTEVMGVVFIGIALLLFAVAWKIFKGKS